MIQRCTNPKRPDYRYYGGRGIEVSPAWRSSFAIFLADMGERPSSEYSIDRFPDQNGNYEADNCRWATKFQQMQNTRATRLIEFNGEVMGISAWARKIGLNRESLRQRLNNDWSIEKALTLGATR